MTGASGVIVIMRTPPGKRCRRSFQLQPGRGLTSSFCVDQIGHLAHLHARNTSFVLKSRAPLANIERYKQRMGWTVPWFSSARTDFNVDLGLTRRQDETFGLYSFATAGAYIART